MMAGKWADKAETEADKTEKQLWRQVRRKFVRRRPEAAVNGPGKTGVVGCGFARADAEKGGRKSQSQVGASRTGWATVAERTGPYPCPCGGWPRGLRSPTPREPEAVPHSRLPGEEEALGGCVSAGREEEEAAAGRDA